jgi:methionyl-tRNA synthetase
VTSALPYANGDIHIGHLVEYLQTDFWVRFQKMQGRNCRYFCADDTHGTPIMIRAQQEGITPESLIAKSRENHLKDFTEFEIKFDHYGSTNSEENRELCSEIFKSIETKGLIETRSISQAYCESLSMFLPDRFVKGECPKCHAKEQYGDACDNCGATYAPIEMIDPVCSINGEKIVLRDSEHIFFKLDSFREYLKGWVREHTPNEVANKLDEWLADTLRDWDISREAPYFGFEIPGHPGKYFYVWVDAPVGYMATTKAWCDANSEKFEDWWKSQDTEIYHFIGKDIVYFHTLFWPVMLKNAEYQTPEQVYVHGFLRVNGEKMSKSKGTFIKARTYLDHLDPMYLRFYYACKLNSSVEDIDLNFEDFLQRVNSDLIGKITNLASRGAQMLGKKLDSKMGNLPEDGKKLMEQARKKFPEIAKHYQARDFNRAMQVIRSIAEDANRYFDEKEPWNLVKTDAEATRGVLTTILNIFRLLAISLKPVLPDYVKKVELLLGEKDYQWQDAEKNLENVSIQKFSHLAKRIEQPQIDAMVEASKVIDEPKVAPTEEYDALEPEIDIDTLFKCDLRIAKIIEAEAIPKASKLLRLKVDLGFETREIIAGIKQAYQPEDLLGRLTVVVANLKPREMKFGTSEGMVMACGPGGKELYLLSPDSGAKPGQRLQ